MERLRMSNNTLAEDFVARTVKEYVRSGLMDGTPDGRFIVQLTRDVSALLDQIDLEDEIRSAPSHKPADTAKPKKRAKS